MHLISTLKGRLRKLVESFKLKKRLVKIIADSRNHFAKRSNGAKKKKQKTKNKIKARKGAVQFSPYLVAFETRPFIGGSLVDNVIFCCCYISLSLPQPSLGFSRLRVLCSGRVSTELLSGSVSFSLCVMFSGPFSPAIKKLAVRAMLTSAEAIV